MTPYLPVSILPFIIVEHLLESDYKLLEMESKDSKHQVCIMCITWVLHDVSVYLGECEYPTHPSDSQNASSFIAVCKTGPGVTCKCPVINVCIRCYNFVSLVFMCPSALEYSWAVCR